LGQGHRCYRHFMKKRKNKPIHDINKEALKKFSKWREERNEGELS
jgi:hypothetical protein